MILYFYDFESNLLYMDMCNLIVTDSGFLKWLNTFMSNTYEILSQINKYKINQKKNLFLIGL